MWLCDKPYCVACDGLCDLDFLKVVRLVFWSGVVGPGVRSLALRARTIALTVALRAQKLDLWASLCVTVRCGSQVQPTKMTLARQRVLSSSEVRASELEHGGLWVRIPSGAQIFSVSSYGCFFTSPFISFSPCIDSCFINLSTMVTFICPQGGHCNNIVERFNCIINYYKLSNMTKYNMYKLWLSKHWSYVYITNLLCSVSRTLDCRVGCRGFDSQG